MNTNYEYQHRDYLMIREWASSYVAFNKHYNYQNVCSYYDDAIESIDDYRYSVCAVHWTGLDGLGQDPDLIHIIREYFEAFAVYDKYVHISREDDWNSPTIMCLLEQLATSDEYDKVCDNPNAAYIWFHQDIRYLVEGLKANPNVLMYNYRLIAKSRKNLHSELLAQFD